MTSKFKSWLQNIQDRAVRPKLVTLRVNRLTQSTVEHTWRIVSHAIDPHGAYVRVLGPDGEVLVEGDDLRVDPDKLPMVVKAARILYGKIGEDTGVIIDPISLPN